MLQSQRLDYEFRSPGVYTPGNHHRSTSRMTRIQHNKPKTRLFICALMVFAGLASTPLAYADKGSNSGGGSAQALPSAPTAGVDSMPRYGIDSGDQMDATALGNGHTAG